MLPFREFKAFSFLGFFINFLLVVMGLPIDEYEEEEVDDERLACVYVADNDWFGDKHEVDNKSQDRREPKCSHAKSRGHYFHLLT